MFENLTLFKMSLNTPVNAKNYSEAFNTYPASIPEDSLATFKSDFSLYGDIAFLLPVPISEYIRNSFLYLQVFIILDCNNTYFTRRCNYDSFQLLYTLSGSGCLEYEGKSYILEEGNGFFIDCRKPHYYYTNGDNWKHCDLHFNGKHAGYFFDALWRSGSVCFSYPIHGLFIAQLEKMLYEYSHVSSCRELTLSNRIETLLLLIIQDTEQKNSASYIPKNIKYLMKYMESNFSNNLTLDSLSAFVGISKYHLCRIFKKYTGFSPNEYLIDLRISQAKLLLKTSNLPAYKIGFLVGITSENNFINLFKKRTGQTPGDYRKNIC